MVSSATFRAPEPTPAEKSLSTTLWIVAHCCRRGPDDIQRRLLFKRSMVPLEESSTLWRRATFRKRGRPRQRWIDEAMNETPSSELRTSSEALLGPNKKKTTKNRQTVAKSWFVFSFEAFCVSQSESGTQRFFLAGVRTPEGRVKADNDNHYITRNSDESLLSRYYPA